MENDDHIFKKPIGIPKKRANTSTILTQTILKEHSRTIPILESTSSNSFSKSNHK
jgi:hypothetical protein